MARPPARNDPCPCGSGRKYKLCCGKPGAAAVRQPAALALGPLTEAGAFLESFSRLRQPVGAPERPDPKRAAREAQAHLNSAARLENAGRRADAIAALRIAVALVPDNAVAHYNLGLLCLKAQQAGEAIACLRQAIALQPDFGMAHYQLGVALQNQGHIEASIAALRTAIANGANRRSAHARLAEMLWATGDRTAAAACFRHAADDTPNGRLYRAKAALVEERYDDARSLLQRALALDPNNPEAEWTLADVLTLLGRFDDAVVHADRAIALAPAAVGAYYTRVYIRRLTPADCPLVDRMRDLLRTTPLPDMSRLRLHYALGKACDDLGDHAEAIQHFDAANRIERPMSFYNRAEMAAWVDLLVERCGPAYFARHTGLGCADETPVFILGMPRSGTTLVEQIVSSHPRAAAGGERDFWTRRGPDWERGSPDAVQALAADYLAELRRIGPDAARVTDKMPYNFMWIGLIRLAFPQARIVHCRRNEVDTCLSIYFTYFLQRMAFANDRDDLVHEYRQYERMMAHWRSVLPPDRFLEVDYENLVADREAWTRRLIGFCGLDWNDACLRPETNDRVVTTASRWQARQPVYRTSVARWRAYEPWLGELRGLLTCQADSERPSGSSVRNSPSHGS